MKYARLSIVTPSHNAGRFIYKALQSVVEQDYPDYEHIVVDNCSNDETVEKIKHFPGVRCVSEHDCGQSDALNKGFRLATGDIIGWLNADEYYLCGVFRRVNQLFAENPDVDLVYGNWYFANSSGAVVNTGQALPYNRRMLIYYGPHIGTAAMFFRRSIIDSGKYLNVHFKYTMEREWLARLALLPKRTLFVNEYFAYYCLHNDNRSGRYQMLGGIDRYIIRAQQLAEGYAIKRCYGHHWGSDLLGGSLMEEATYRILWRFYRYKALLLKVGCLARLDRREARRKIAKRLRGMVRWA